MPRSLARIVLPVLFFGGAAGLLVLGETLGGTQATTVVVNTPEFHVTLVPEPWRKYPSCESNTDCPLPSTYCGGGGKCVDLVAPRCDCSQPQVLRCAEESGRARYLFCKEACVQTEDGAICQ